MPVKKNRFLLLYGSQTGQAQAIAEEIAEKAEAEDLHADIFCLSHTEKKFFIEREKCVVIVTSTTGDGEPPDTALKFVRRLRKKTLSDTYLSRLNYAILGLGDSNYTNFCNCGKTLDKRLLELGAKHFYPPGWADDAVGLEVAVEPWIDGLLQAMRNFLNKDSGDIHQADSAPEIQRSPLDINGSATGTCGPQAIDDSTRTCGDINKSEKSSSVTESERTKINDSNKVCNTDTIKNASNVSLRTREAQDVVITTNESNEEQQRDVQLQPTSSVPNSAATQSDCGQVQSSTQSDSSQVEAKEASVRHSLPPLSESNLTLPVLPPPYLRMTYSSDQIVKDVWDQPPQNGCDFPSAASSVSMATVISMTTLTAPTSVKKAMAVKLDVKDTEIKYEPGDSFSLICPNTAEEVMALLNRLGVEEKADMQCKIDVQAGTKKKNPSVPRYIPETSTLRHIFTTCLDIREPPKKALFRAMVEYTSDPSEKRRLQELCSKQGATDYTKHVREPALSCLDVLTHFPSCDLPMERLLEHLPRLQPRPYSVCSSPICEPGVVEFVFNVVEVAATDRRTYPRKGVCTGWLEQLSPGTPTQDPGVEQAMENLHISENLKVPVFARTNQHFRLPEDVTAPLILIGPGTGVAPFVGFLDQRASQRACNSDMQFGEVWLFYGCRHKDRDYLFRDKLESHIANSSLSKLLVSFSRDEQPEGSPRYVQDNIRAQGRELFKLLEEQNAIVYVCGDAKNMARDVSEAFAEIYSKEKGISMDEAKKQMMLLRLAKRYREDVWT